MLDIKFIRENSDAVAKAAEQKSIELNFDDLFSRHDRLLELTRELQSLQEEKNAIAKSVPKASAEERPQLIAKGKEVGQSIESMNPKMNEAQDKLNELLYIVPQIPSKEAPIGPDESGNVVVKEVGEKTRFDFKPKDHVEIVQERNWADLERIGKVCGSRSYSLKNDLVLIEMAILNLAMQKLREKSFDLISVPAMARESALFGTGHFPTGKEQVYYLPEDDIYLAGTCEVVINSLHSGEKLTADQLPITYGGYSACFRREAGSAGRDVRGLIRVHQFVKVEQFVICEASVQESEKWLQELLSISESIVQDLELPYQVLDVCTGDMGAGKYRQYDIECWVPSEEKYRETHSCSALLDWQARRTGLRYRNADKKMQYCHTLNNTAIASPRILVPFLENHQREDGKLNIPTKLRPFLGGAEIL